MATINKKQFEPKDYLIAFGVTILIRTILSISFEIWPDNFFISIFAFIGLSIIVLMFYAKITHKEFKLY